METFFSKSEKETMKLSERLAKKIKSPKIILLYGDLGAGKTHFVKGFAKGLKAKSTVTSPTFTIMNSYVGGRLPIYHFDMYRLSSADEAREAGLEEYFDQDKLDGVSIVEWPENVKGLIRGKVLNITIEKGEEATLRKICVKEEEC